MYKIKGLQENYNMQQNLMNYQFIFLKKKKTNKKDSFFFQKTKFEYDLDSISTEKRNRPCFK